MPNKTLPNNLNNRSNDKIPDVDKLKTFADDKLTRSQMTNFRLVQTQSLHTTILNMMEMTESSS